MYIIETGSSDYKKFIEQNKYYIDKTMLIEELLTKVGEVVLITRPRRFGKTSNLSMLEYYFDIRQDSDYLFKNKKIVSTEIYKEHLNKYPVIFLTLKSIEGSSFENIYSSFKTAISNLYGKYKYLKEKLDEIDKNLFDKILSKNADIGDYKNSLYKLSEFMYKYYNRRVIILLDEYDSMINSLIDQNLYDSVMELLKGLISDAFKGNDYLEKGILTGILRIAKESLFSGANNIAVRTILDNDFKDKFGLTEQEVIESLKRFNLEEHLEELRDWYNGYLFGKEKITIYNPYSIANYLLEKELKSYWINTGHDTFIKNLLFNANFEVKTTLLELIKGKKVDVYIEDNIIMSELNHPENIWGLLLFSGYITSRSNEDYIHTVKTVNKEVIIYLEKIIKIHFNKIIGSAVVLDALLKGDMKKFEEEMHIIAESKISYYDVVNENSYHMFLFGLFLNLEKYYNVKSNREAGFGRYDLILDPYDNSIGYIIELKKVEDILNLEEKLEKSSKEALKQIREKRYRSALKVNKVIGIGISFCGKKVKISSDFL